LLDEANLILPRPTFVAMATTIVEFGQKLIKVVGAVVVFKFRAVTVDALINALMR